MRIHIDAHHIRVLAEDCNKVPLRLVSEVSRVVEETAKDGNKHAQDFARATARRHGKWYPSSMSAERYGLLTWIYGPKGSPPRQGLMSFEHGSRNQPPHLDLAHSADIIGPRFSERVGKAVGRALSAFE